MLCVSESVRGFVPLQCWPRSGRTAVIDDHARPRTTTYDHARPRTTTHDGPRTTTHDHARTTDHARPRTTAAHHHARPRTTTHDHARPRATAAHDHARPRTTAHDRPRLPYLFEEAVPTPPHGGFRSLNCLARLALARERTPSISKLRLINGFKCYLTCCCCQNG